MAAGNSVIGALRVSLAADTADLETGLKSAGSSIATFAKSAAAQFAVVTAAVGLTTAAITTAITKTIDDMEKLNKSSQKLGITVEELSKLAVAADLADISFETLSKSVVKLSKNMVEAAANPTSEAAKAFRALGVSVTDSNGKIRSSDEVLAQLADSFAGLKDGAGKTAAAVAIFGKAGADMIPLLNGGAKAINEAKQAAQDFGVVVSAGAAKSAEAFNDNLKLLGLSTQGIFNKALQEVLPTMENVSRAFVESAKTSVLVKIETQALTVVLQGLVSAVIVVSAAVQAATLTWTTFLTAMKQVLSADFTGAFETLRTSASGFGEIATKSFNELKGLWDGSTKAANDNAVATTNATKSQKEFNFNVLAGKNAVDTFIESQVKKLAGLNSEIATFGQYSGAVAAAKIQEEALAIAKANGLTITAKQQAALNAVTLQIQAQKLALEGLQLAEANLTPAEQLIKQQEKIQFLFDNGAISAETYGRAMEKAAEKAQASWDIAGASIAGSFKDIAASFGKENKAMATAAKIFGAIQATISMFTGAAKALELPFPANLAAMAAVLAKGAALVASIKGQSIPGAAQGLSMQVPGGLGGGDSRLFQAMVEPGEQIDVTPNSQRGGTTRAVVEVRGLTDKRYSIDEVKQIMKGIGDAMKFGYKFENA